MKVVKMMSGAEYPVDDDEAENIARVSNGADARLVQLRSGRYINVRSIEDIGDPPKIALYKGFRVDGNYYWDEGNRIHIDHPEKIEYIDDPKYQKLAALQSGAKQLESHQYAEEN